MFSATPSSLGQSDSPSIQDENALPAIVLPPAVTSESRGPGDSDQDGLPDEQDSCPAVSFAPEFKACNCAAMDLNPSNDPQPECQARERVAQMLVGPNGGILVTRMAFAVVTNGELHFADAFTYLGAGQYEHDPEGVHRLYRIGSTTKPMTAVAAKVLEEAGQLSLSDFVNDDDATQEFVGGQRTLGQLMTHRGAFKVDNGAIHLFCYPNGLSAFWLEPDDLISPHYNSAVYGNLGGGYNYSAFNYSLAGAYLANRTGLPFQHILQTRIFDLAGMCTASLDGQRAKNSTIGAGPGISQAAVMHVGPYINLVSPTDPLCEDNFYSSNDVYGQSSYSWQYYQLDEAAAEPRDPAGGVIASAIDLAHFAESLLASYHGTGGLLSPAGIRQLWEATSDLGCGSGCPYERYYGTGFFTNSLPGQSVTQVGHGGSRGGYATAFVLRPEANTAVCILSNADLSTVALSNLAKTILDDFEAAASWGDLDLTSFVNVLIGTDLNPAHMVNADKNCDGAANGQDIELYVRHVLGLSN
ncbi:MAG TPA: serine hydrolase domain-containing protein [Phycisphaerae bacterium]|nr:serine hydrolase domain-containing protein [Phycisphaerae bacterium]